MVAFTFCRKAKKPGWEALENVKYSEVICLSQIRRSFRRKSEFLMVYSRKRVGSEVSSEMIKVRTKKIFHRQ